MWDMVCDMWGYLKNLGGRITDAWRNFTSAQKGSVMLGVGVTVAAWLAGPVVFPYAIGGILANVMFWSILQGSEAALRFMSHYGVVLDIALTVGSFFASGGVFSTWMMMLLGMSYFTIFRTVLAPPESGGLVSWIKRKIFRIEEE